MDEEIDSLFIKLNTLGYPGSRDELMVVSNLKIMVEMATRIRELEDKLIEAGIGI